MEKCVNEVMAKGRSKDSAIAICHASLMGENTAMDYILDPDAYAIKARKDISKADKERAVKEYGNVKFADPINKKYPIDTEEHIRSAWNYIGQAKNQEQYSEAEVSAIKKRIIAAWKREIDPAGPPGADNNAAKVMGADIPAPEWGSMYLIDEYITVQPGEPYRLFPFGRLVKNGKVRDITPEYARTFRLPHFRPPIKLGSHKETTPAGGFITGLEVREDGLYANVEWNDKGDQAVKDGAYRYQSPEVIWDDSGLEDPKTGEMIPGPMILGDALLHTPHLGEDAALYTIEQIMPVPQAKGDDDVMADELEEKKGVINRLTAWLFPRPAEPEEPEPQPTVEELEAAKAEATRLEAEAKQKQAELDKLQAEQAHKERVDSFAAQVKEFGIEDKAGEMLAALSDEAAGWFITQFSALHEQIKLNDRLTEEIGSEKTVPTDQMSKQEQLNAAIMAKAKEINPDKPMAAYSAALAVLAVEKPELF